MDPPCDHNQYFFFWNRKNYCLSPPLRNYIPIDESLNDSKDTFDIMFKEFDKLTSKLEQQPPPAQVSPDLAQVDDNQV